jgi:dTDP-4-dehydrorhamnose reductase
VPRTLLVTGGSGFVGGHVLAAALAGGWRAINADLVEVGGVQGIEFCPLDITDGCSVSSLIGAARPDAIIHLAAIGDVDQSERDPRVAWRVNAEGTANIARAASDVGARLLFISTSTVFDGQSGCYREDDPPHPINIYGRSKVAAEQAVKALCPSALIVRISMAYGYPRTGGASFLTRVEEKLRAAETTVQPSDEFRTPIDVLSLADGLVEIAGTDISGVLHLGPRERISRYDFALKIARRLGADASLVVDRRGETLPDRAPRPKDVSFNTELAHRLVRTPLLRTDEGLDRVMGAAFTGPGADIQSDSTRAWRQGYPGQTTEAQ